MDQKVAVVTGGASGIGRAIANKFATTGFKVVVGDLRFKDADTTNASFSPEILCIGADLRDAPECNRLIDTAVHYFGRIDVLCNNVGVRHLAPITQMELAAWDAVLSVNLRAAVVCSKSAFPHLTHVKGGIINIASRAGITPRQGGSAYCVSKAALIMLTKVLALEGAPLGIRVNCICPGAIDVGHVSSATIEDIARSIPIGRVGRPEEVADLAAYLASENAAYITGSIMSIDGGITAKGH